MKVGVLVCSFLIIVEYLNKLLMKETDSTSMGLPMCEPSLNRKLQQHSTKCSFMHVCLMCYIKIIIPLTDDYHHSNM